MNIAMFSLPIRWSRILLCGLWLGVVPAGQAQCLLERYWPMHDGDTKYYLDPLGTGYIRFSSYALFGQEYYESFYDYIGK